VVAQYIIITEDPECEMTENHRERKEQFCVILGNQLIPADDP